MGNALIFLGTVMGRKVVIASDVVMPQLAGSIPDGTEVSGLP